MNLESLLPKPAELYAQWKRDRELQCRMPLRKMSRGVVGLAMIVRGFDANAIAISDRTFLPNHAVSWIQVQDIPPGRFPHSPKWNYFGATLATEASAVLAYGFPVIDFSASARNAVNLKLDPLWAAYSIYSPVLDLVRDRRLATVMVALTSSMTSAAYYGLDVYGHPLRAAWYYERPLAQQRFTLEEPSTWMPRAHAVFDFATLNRAPWIDRWLADHIREIGTETGDGKWVVPFDRITGRMRIVRPVGIWWEISHSDRYLSYSTEAFVFPAVPLHGQDAQGLHLPGAVRVILSMCENHQIAFTKKSKRVFVNRPRSAA